MASLDILDPTIIECLDGYMYIGSREGSLGVYKCPHLPQGPPCFTIKSKQDSPIRQFVMFDSCTAFVVSSDNRAFGVRLHNLDLIAGLVMRDVVTMCVVNPSTLAICTPKSVVLLEVEGENIIRPKRTLEYSGIVSAVATNELLVVATKHAYELVNIETESRIPLFPLSEAVRPFVLVVSHSEILVVQGTAPNEPAMGVIFNEKGEVSRFGDMITWEAYPQSICIQDDHVVALVGSVITLHSLATGRLINSQEHLDPKPNELFKVISPAKISNSQLLDKFGDEKLAELTSHILIHYQDGTINWYNQPPSFFEYEQRILQNSLTEVTLDLVPVNSVAGVAQLEYLSILLALQSLKTEKYSRAIRAFLNGIKIDPKITLYIFGNAESPGDLYPGLSELIEELRHKPKSENAQVFYKKYLGKQIERQKIASNNALLEQLEQTYASLLDGKTLVDFAGSRSPESLEKIIVLLKKQGRYEVVEQVYRKTRQNAELYDTWAKLARCEHPCPPGTERTEYLSKMVNFLRTCDNYDFVWSRAIDLTSLDTDAGLQVLTKSKLNFEEDKVLQALKPIGNGTACYKYLQHLVNDLGKPLYANDLVLFIANTLVEQLRKPGLDKFVSTLYKEYQNLNWPKGDFHAYLQDYANSTGDQTRIKFVNTELELCKLILLSVSDAVEVRSFLEEHAKPLLLERCLASCRIGLHEQALNLLISEMTDYKGVLNYCLYGNPMYTYSVSGTLNDNLTKELSRLAYSQLLNCQASPRRVRIEFLELLGGHLNLSSIIESSDDQEPIHTMQHFLVSKIQEFESNGALKALQRQLAKASVLELDYKIGSSSNDFGI